VATAGLTAAIAVTEAGWRARAALRRAGGEARVVAALSRSIWLEAAGDIVWLGEAGAPRHGRALLAPALPAADRMPRIEVAGTRTWRPSPPPPDPAVIEAEAAELAARAAGLGAPAGFGLLLAGRTPPFPLDHAVGRVLDLARACAAGDAGAAARAAVGLLGVGPGLTPSGDDVVGAALFARRLLARGPQAAAWARAADLVRARAAVATHAISAALLGDLVGGEGHEPLHDLAAALAAADRGGARQAARRLVAIGHSSGWDMLLGFLAGAGAGDPAGLR